MLKRIKVILVDVLGVVLIVGAIAFGWLPGIGGIPLFLAGLGLLATNHEWARRVLDYTKHKGAHLYSKIFNDHPHLMWLYDILSVALAATCVSLLVYHDSYWVRSVAFLFLTLSIMVFFANRQRLQKLYNKIRRKR